MTTEIIVCIGILLAAACALLVIFYGANAFLSHDDGYRLGSYERDGRIVHGWHKPNHHEHLRRRR